MRLEYHVETGKEITQWYIHSYVDINEYNCQHISPVVQVTRKGEGIVIPSEYVSISPHQPLKSR